MGHCHGGFDEQQLENVCSSPPGYSATAFHQAALQHEEAAIDSNFNVLCETVQTHTLIVTYRPRTLSEKIIYLYALCNVGTIIRGDCIANVLVSRLR